MFGSDRSFLNCSLEIQVIHLTGELHIFEFLTFLLLGNFVETSARLLQILTTFLLKRFDAELPAVLNDFDIAIANGEVLAFCCVWLLILITVELVRGKTAQASIDLLLSHHDEIILLKLILLVLLND